MQMKLQNNKVYHSLKWTSEIAVIMCFVTVPIAMGYKESKTSHDSKNKKRGMEKSTPIV